MNTDGNGGKRSGQNTGQCVQPAHSWQGSNGTLNGVHDLGSLLRNHAARFANQGNFAYEVWTVPYWFQQENLTHTATQNTEA